MPPRPAPARSSAGILLTAALTALALAGCSSSDPAADPDSTGASGTPTLRLSAERARPGETITVELSAGDRGFGAEAGGSLQLETKPDLWITAYSWAPDGSLSVLEVDPDDRRRLELPSAETMELPETVSAGNYRVIKRFFPVDEEGSRAGEEMTAIAPLRIELRTP